MKECSACGEKVLFNMATRQYYCPSCGGTSNVAKYEKKQPQKPKKGGCGCGRKKRKS